MTPIPEETEVQTDETESEAVEETPEVAEGAADAPEEPVKDATNWVAAPFEHIVLEDNMGNPHVGTQIHMWIDSRDEVSIRFYEWVDARQVQLGPAAMKKLVAAWQAHEQAKTPGNFSSILNNLLG